MKDYCSRVRAALNLLLLLSLLQIWVLFAHSNSAEAIDKDIFNLFEEFSLYFAPPEIHSMLPPPAAPLDGILRTVNDAVQAQKGFDEIKLATFTDVSRWNLRIALDGYGFDSLFEADRLIS